MSRKMTQDEFVSALAEKNSIYKVLGTYEGQSTPVLVECTKCHQVSEKLPSSLLRNPTQCRGCFAIGKRKMTKDEYVNALASKKPDIELVGEFTMLSESATFRCKKCGRVWTTLARTVLNTTGCPDCGIRKRANSKAVSKEEFEARLSATHPSIVLVGEFNRLSSEVTVKCEDCGDTWNVMPTTILRQTSGCQTCKRKEKMKDKNNTFVKTLAEINPLVVPTEDYVGKYKRIEFECGRCGKHWETTPASVLSGSGCPRCNVASNSFFEHALLNALKQSVGDDLVLSRHTDAVGAELDIYIPSLDIAFEPGAWFYHKNRLDNDIAKYEMCCIAGIKLEVIYTGYKNDGVKIPDYCYTIENPMLIQDWDVVVSEIKNIMDRNGFSHENVDWDKVKLDSKMFSGRKTTSQFKDDISGISPDIEILGEYSSSGELVLVRCKRCGREWKAQPNNLYMGKGCAKCRKKDAGIKQRTSHDEFIRRVKELSPHLKIHGTYEGRESYVKVECTKCGRIWDAKCDNLLQGKECPSCSRKKSNEWFLEQLKKVHPDITPLEPYVDSRTLIKVKCEKCGRVWTTTSRRLLDGDGCEGCSWKANGEKLRKTDEQFRKDLKEKQPTMEALEPYVKSSSPMKFRCLKCGWTWSARPSNILSGKGCPECKRLGIVARRTVPLEEFERQLKEKHPTLEVVGDWAGMATKTIVRCKICGNEWTPLPYNLLRSKGCRICNK